MPTSGKPQNRFRAGPRFVLMTALKEYLEKDPSWYTKSDDTIAETLRTLVPEEIHRGTNGDVFNGKHVSQWRKNLGIQRPRGFAAVKNAGVSRISEMMVICLNNRERTEELLRRLEKLEHLLNQHYDRPSIFDKKIALQRSGG